MASLFKRSSNPDHLRQYFDLQQQQFLHLHQRHYPGPGPEVQLQQLPGADSHFCEQQQQHAPETLFAPSTGSTRDTAAIQHGRVVAATAAYRQNGCVNGANDPSTPPSPVAAPLPRRPAKALLSLQKPHYHRQPPSRNLLLCDFELLETLGTGTFGRVYLARAKGSDTFYAMKVLKKLEVVRLMQVEHINSEKQILSSINFPFIVNLQCTFQDDRNLYMLLEYVIGGELFSHLRRAGRFTNDMTRFYAAEIVLAIEYLHDMDIVYRDLKPENLLLDERGHIKITDFGFAKKVEDRTWTLCGTPEYLAPEIIQSKGHGKAVDWWALGILIFEMLAGYPPFFDDNPFGIYEKILAGRIQFPSYFDPNARDLIRCLLSADRTRRLGNLRGGSEDVRRHKWFRGVDWDSLLEKRIRAPIVPPCSHPGDTGNFEKYPEPPAEDDRGPTADPFRELFIDF